VSTAAVSDAERLRMREPTGAPAVMRQVWSHLAFLHWPVEPAAVAPLLPRGLEVDLFEGRAYVGVVPFTIGGLLRFHEINVRTYVHRGGRDPGVWFFSLDAASRLAVAGARLAYKLPYFFAQIEMAVVAPTEAGGLVIDYRARRVGRATRSPRGAAPPRFACRYAASGPAAPARPSTLEMFLVERYLLYAWDGRRLRTARVEHVPYALAPASATDLDQTLTVEAGLPPLDGPPLAHYVATVDVRIHAPHRLPPLAP
jgi:hypothetical protein